MASNWIDEIFEKEWYVIVKRVKAIGVGGFPDVYTECYVSTSPHDNEKGYRLINAQRWYGSKEFEGYIEHRLMQRVVELHNADLAKKKQSPLLVQSLEA
jgi:hypothetical protein